MNELPWQGLEAQQGGAGAKEKHHWVALR